MTKKHTWEEEFDRLSTLSVFDDENGFLGSYDSPALPSIKAFIARVEQEARREERLAMQEAAELMAKDMQSIEIPCGVFLGKDMNERQKDAGCGKPVKMLEAYRCTDCSVHFHRECLEKHFKEPSIRKREQEIIDFINHKHETKQ